MNALANGQQNGTYQRPRILGPDGQPIAPSSFALPHQYEFAGLINQASRTYSWRFDDAMRKTPEDAKAMRRDCFLMGLLRERQYPTEQMAWHLEPENPKDTVQAQVAAAMTLTVKAIPRLRRYLRSLLEAIWYGRSGPQQAWDWTEVSGARVYSVVNHQHVNGDKIQFGWDGVPRVLVYSPYAAELEAQGAEIVITDRGTALVLNQPYWRTRFAIHKHDCVDADFYEPDSAGGIHGLGVRHWIYWYDWLKKELLGWLIDFMERTGLGLTLYFYEQGNPQSEAAARKAAKEDGRNTVVVWPVPPGGNRGTGQGVERIETSVTGAEYLRQVIEDYFDAKIERFVIGQTLSSGTEGSGLGGTGVSKLHADTKYRIIKDDAENLAETLTEDLVAVLQRFNYPLAKFKVKWVFDVDQPNPEEKLNAAKVLFDMGIPVRMDEVRSVAGFSKPEPGDEVAWQSPSTPSPGGEPGGEDGQPPAREVAEQDKQYQYGTDAHGHEHAPAGSAEGGQFTSKQSHAKAGRLVAKADKILWDNFKESRHGEEPLPPHSHLRLSLLPRQSAREGVESVGQLKSMAETLASQHEASGETEKAKLMGKVASHLEEAHGHYQNAHKLKGQEAADKKAAKAVESEKAKHLKRQVKQSIGNLVRAWEDAPTGLNKEHEDKVNYMVAKIQEGSRDPEDFKRLAVEAGKLATHAGTGHFDEDEKPYASDMVKSMRKIGSEALKVAKMFGEDTAQHYSRDAQGHEHAPAGSPEGGRFTRKMADKLLGNGSSPVEIPEPHGEKFDTQTIMVSAETHGDYHAVRYDDGRTSFVHKDKIESAKKAADSRKENKARFDKREKKLDKKWEKDAAKVRGKIDTKLIAGVRHALSSSGVSHDNMMFMLTQHGLSESAATDLLINLSFTGDITEVRSGGKVWYELPSKEDKQSFSERDESPVTYTTDAQGNEHAPAGSSEGGRFTGKLKTSFRDDVDKAVKAGHKEVFRGVPNPKHGAAMRRGEPFVGEGDYGNGLYFTTSEWMAGSYASGPEGHGQGAVVRGAIHPGAKLVNIEQVQKMFDAAVEAGEVLNTMDTGDFARSKGIDGILVPHKHYVNVVNPDVLTVQKDPHKYQREESPVIYESSPGRSGVLSRVKGFLSKVFGGKPKSAEDWMAARAGLDPAKMRVQPIKWEGGADPEEVAEIIASLDPDDLLGSTVPIAEDMGPDVGPLNHYLYAGEWAQGFRSSNVEAFRYLIDDHKLEIEYKNGNYYQYDQVTPAEALSLAVASSKGTWVWDNLRVRGTVYGYKKPYLFLDAPSKSSPRWFRDAYTRQKHGEIGPAGEDVYGHIPGTDIHQTQFHWREDWPEFYVSGDGRWVTIGAHGEPGEKHGGTPVFINDGKIEKGPTHMVGKSPDQLKKNPEKSDKSSSTAVDKADTKGDNTPVVNKPQAQEKPMETKELPKLQGSEKQSAWAEKIRAEALVNFTGEDASDFFDDAKVPADKRQSVLGWLSRQDSSEFWIDRKSKDHYGLAKEAMKAVDPPATVKEAIGEGMDVRILSSNAAMPYVRPRKDGSPGYAMLDQTGKWVVAPASYRLEGYFAKLPKVEVS